MRPHLESISVCTLLKGRAGWGRGPTCPAHGKSPSWDQAGKLSLIAASSCLLWPPEAGGRLRGKEKGPCLALSLTELGVGKGLGVGQSLGFQLSLGQVFATLSVAHWPVLTTVHSDTTRLLQAH
jgi:hypothetical protein